MPMALSATLFAVACGGGAKRPETTKTPATNGGVDLTGAGATFPYPIYSKWFSDYATKTGVKINYQSIGSGGGVRQFSEQTVDFGASDAPMTDEDIAKAKGGPVLHVPTVLGADVITYNLPEVKQPLKLTGDLVAEVFLGRIKRWSDPRIVALNKDAALPAKDILVVHRSDGSGTTYVFTDYLSAVSPAWAHGPGKGKDVQWPAGLGAKGNEGVSGQVKQTPGSIGYVELAYAKQNGLAMAEVRNANGEFVAATLDAIAAAGAGVKPPANDDYRISIVNALGKGVYPISSFTWLLVYRNQPNADKGRKLVDFLEWALHEGEASARTLDYAPLPAAFIPRLDSTIATIRIGAAP
jgi:phosphate transport system substrate-binding protein